MSDSGRSASSPLHSTFRMRVLPEDGGPEFASKLSAGHGDALHLQAGRWTYVLYDPHRPDHCELDRDRLAKEFGLLPDGKPPRMIPRGTSGPLTADTVNVADAFSQPPAPAGDVTEQLTRLADLRDRGALTQTEFEAEKAKLLEAS